MTIPSDIQVFRVAYEMHFSRPFASISCCSRVKIFGKVTFWKNNSKYVLLANANLN
jgi:hypothetical protein